MALADPQSLTIGGNTASLPRISFGATSGAFGTADATARLDVSHAVSKRARRLVKVTSNKIAVDPITAVNQRVSASVHLVIDNPNSGFSVAEMHDLVKALTTWCAASSGANVVKVLGGES